MVWDDTWREFKQEQFTLGTSLPPISGIGTVAYWYYLAGIVDCFLCGSKCTKDGFNLIALLSVILYSVIILAMFPAVMLTSQIVKNLLLEVVTRLNFPVFVGAVIGRLGFLIKIGLGMLWSIVGTEIWKLTRSSCLRENNCGDNPVSLFKTVAYIADKMCGVYVADPHSLCRRFFYQSIDFVLVSIFVALNLFLWNSKRAQNPVGVLDDGDGAIPPQVVPPQVPLQNDQNPIDPGPGGPNQGPPPRNEPNPGPYQNPPVPGPSRPPAPGNSVEPADVLQGISSEATAQAGQLLRGIEHTLCDPCRAAVRRVATGMDGGSPVKRSRTRQESRAEDETSQNRRTRGNTRSGSRSQSRSRSPRSRSRAGRRQTLMPTRQSRRIAAKNKKYTKD